MSIPLAFAVYFTIWWTVLFAVLPWGVRSLQEEGGGPVGADPGAPANPRLLIKAGWTTVVATIIFAGFWFYVEYL